MRGFKKFVEMHLVKKICTGLRFVLHKNKHVYLSLNLCQMPDHEQPVGLQYGILVESLASN